MKLPFSAEILNNLTWRYKKLRYGNNWSNATLCLVLCGWGSIFIRLRGVFFFVCLFYSAKDLWRIPSEELLIGRNKEAGSIKWMRGMDDDNSERCVKRPNLNIIMKQLCQWLTPNCVIRSAVALRSVKQPSVSFKRVFELDDGTNTHQHF